jgi:hypothetical protein
MQAMSYIILEANCTMEMIAMVQDACHDGWRVTGGIAVTNDIYDNPKFYQAMTHEDREAKQPAASK